MSISESSRAASTSASTPACISPTRRPNAADPVLNIIEPDMRRRTLIAQREMRGDVVIYRFDISLQGEQETVFFDV
jgi:protocatechuate 3,4-dioxygenase alpha subunit